MEGSLRHALNTLVTFGVVEVAGVVEVPSGLSGYPKKRGGEAALTPLGQWTVRRMLGETASAPIAGGWRDAGATELLQAAADMIEPEARAEIQAWVAHRSASEAAAELVAALPGVGETERGL
ncbi:MAG TPA: hypothetical protein VE173_05425, partial [Longimicrobiales bacterium]|nr:hypothetical protein [Longimicrobiales bacterium]